MLVLLIMREELSVLNYTGGQIQRECKTPDSPAGILRIKLIFREFFRKCRIDIGLMINCNVK